jgi:hypothetical protein
MPGAGAVPFLLSIVLLGISVWIRLQMKRVAGLPEDEGGRQGTPRRRSPKPSASGRTLKIALLALLGLVAGQAVVWYTGQFYALFFLQQMLQGRQLFTGQHADRLVAGPGHWRLHRVFGCAVGQDWPQAHHPGRLPDRRH